MNTYIVVLNNGQEETVHADSLATGHGTLQFHVKTNQSGDDAWDYEAVTIAAYANGQWYTVKKVEPFAPGVV